MNSIFDRRLWAVGMVLPLQTVEFWSGSNHYRNDCLPWGRLGKSSIYLFTAIIHLLVLMIKHHWELATSIKPLQRRDPIPSLSASSRLLWIHKPKGPHHKWHNWYPGNRSMLTTCRTTGDLLEPFRSLPRMASLTTLKPKVHSRACKGVARC